MSTIVEPARLSLRLEMAGTLLTPEEFDAAECVDDTYSYELIHGVLVVAALPLPSETGPNQTLGNWLENYRLDHPQGSVLDGTLPEQIIRTRAGRRRADRLLWIGLGRTPRVKEDVPRIAVEFVSESRRDRRRDYQEKKVEYMELGIGEYWIIDRFRRTLTVVRKIADVIEEVVVSEGETYRTGMLPGFVLDLENLLAVADHWAVGE
jgi:Uma2 family endonuclease